MVRFLGTIIIFKRDLLDRFLEETLLFNMELLDQYGDRSIIALDSRWDGETNEMGIGFLRECKRAVDPLPDESPACAAAFGRDMTHQELALCRQIYNYLDEWNHWSW